LPPSCSGRRDVSGGIPPIFVPRLDRFFVPPRLKRRHSPNAPPPTSSPPACLSPSARFLFSASELRKVLSYLPMKGPRPAFPQPHISPFFTCCLPPQSLTSSPQRPRSPFSLRNHVDYLCVFYTLFTICCLRSLSKPHVKPCLISPLSTVP